MPLCENTRSKMTICFSIRDICNRPATFHYVWDMRLFSGQRQHTPGILPLRPPPHMLLRQPQNKCIWAVERVNVEGPLFLALKHAQRL